MGDAKKIGKQLEALILITNAALPVINEHISIDVHPHPIIRSYSTFMTGLNLLVGYSTTWNYTRKLLDYISKEKVSIPEQELKNYQAKLLELFNDSKTQFNVIINSLSDLSNKYDRLTSSISADIRSLHDLSIFLSNELVKLEKLVKQIDIIKEYEKSGAGELTYIDPVNITGGRKHKEDKEDDRKQEYEEKEVITIINKKGVNKCRKRIEKLYKILGGEEVEEGKVLTIGDVKHIIGQEETQQLKSKIFKLQSIHQDIKKRPQIINDSYLTNIFIPCVKDLFNLRLDELTNVANMSPHDYLSLMIDKCQPQKLLLEQLTKWDELYKFLYQYYDERKQTDSPDLPQKPSINMLTQEWATSISKITSYVSEWMSVIYKIDEANIEERIQQEFDIYGQVRNKSKELETLKQDMDNNIKLLYTPGFDPFIRRNCRHTILYLLNKINALLPIILPKLRKGGSIDKENKDLANITKYLSCLDKIVALESDVMPEYIKIEYQYDRLAKLIYLLFSTLESTFSSRNKKTCIGRTGLVVQMIIRKYMLEHLAGSTDIDKKKILVKLILDIDEEDEHKDKSNISKDEINKIAEEEWYSPAEGFNNDVIENLIRLVLK